MSDLPQYVYFLSPAAILVSSVIALITGYRTIQTNRRVARVRASLDVLFRIEGDPSFVESASVFKDVRSGSGLMSLLKEDHSKSKRDKDEEFQVDTYLNHLELICVGISEDAIDELIVFQYMRGTLIHHWHDAKEYIRACRVQVKNKRVFEKLELFATAWEDERFVTRSEPATKYTNANAHSGDPQDQSVKQKAKGRARKYLTKRLNGNGSENLF